MDIKKKAVIVGVSDYQNYAPSLEAATGEMMRWHDLLRTKYGFSQIRILPNAKATRNAVLGSLEWLLTDATPKDQLVFIAHCHGRVVATHDPSGGYRYEEALIVHPAGDKTLRSAEITDSDITKIFRKTKPPAGAVVSLVVDACFAGALDVPLPPGAKRQYIEPEVSFSSLEQVREFGAIVNNKLESSIERPVVVAAAGRDQNAHQVDEAGGKRLLFSLRAIEYLTRQDATYESLVADIQPLRDGYDQTPELRGNRRRDNDPFPGRVAPPLPALSRAASDVMDVPAESVQAMAGATIEIRFKGICCFADAQRETDPYAKRVLLPHDSRVDPAKRHIAYVEIPEKETVSYDKDPTATEEHDDGGRDKYHRWHLSGHRIEFMDADTSEPFIVNQAYTKYVPTMKYDICPTLDYHPRQECFLDPPPPSLVAASTDLSCGELTIGPLEPNAITFTNRAGEVSPWRRERTPKWVALRLPMRSPTLTVRLTSSTGDVNNIVVKASGYVLIGNARAIDIIEPRTPTENPREHYHLFYELSDPASKPEDPPLPDDTLVPTNACSPTGWP